MADDYWDHPSRREIKRLIDLGDAGAILDELQQGSTEWDDAREALDHLVRGSRPEVERLRAELRDRRTDDLDIRGILKPAPGVGDPAVPMPLGPALAPAIERLRAELAVTGEKVTALRKQRDTAEAERDAAREQVKRVRAEHPQETDAQDRPVCGACRDAYEEPVPWPCPTISALDGTEPGQ